MENLENKLRESSIGVKGVNPKLVTHFLNKYKKIPEEDRKVNMLLKKLKKENPHIFSPNIITKKIVGPGEQNKLKKKVQGEKRNLESWRNMIPISLKNKEIVRITQKIRKLFSTKHYKYAQRIKNSKTLLENIEANDIWGGTDLVGLRIVPKQSDLFPHTIRKFEKEFGDNIVFKLNFFSKQQKKAARIRTSSNHYYAINYYFAIPPFFIEVQIRTPGVDLWSDLTHDSIYKHKTRISSSLESSLNKFGEMCNAVDFFEIISSRNKKS